MQSRMRPLTARDRQALVKLRFTDGLGPRHVRFTCRSRADFVADVVELLLDGALTPAPLPKPSTITGDDQMELNEQFIEALDLLLD